MSFKESGKAGPARAILKGAKGRFAAIGLFSALINLLMLNGSLYMLQVYDRVFVSRSLPTLVTVTVLTAGLYAVQALFDVTRQRLLVLAAREVEARLRTAAHAATVRLSAAGRGGANLVADLDNLRQFLSGAGPSAFFDLPWVPLFLLFSCLVHPAVGALSLVGGGLMVALTLMVKRLSRGPSARAAELRGRRRLAAETERRHAETVLAMGMLPALAERQNRLGAAEASAFARLSHITGGLGAVSRVTRMLIQSLLLGLGAYLVITGRVSGGATIASSIMVGRCLAPIDQVIAHWSAAAEARAALARLDDGLVAAAEAETGLRLPAPRNSLGVDGVSLAVGDRPVVSGLQFGLTAGDVLAVVGPSGSGKSTLLKALAGLLAPRSGSIRLDGATLDQHDAAALGRHIGYVAQSVGLFEGTVAENIARMDAAPDADRVLEAARAAGVEDLVLALPKGFDTPIGDQSGPLSGGQRQRIALARAFYGNPFLILLDEANANLDTAGEARFAAAVRGAAARGAIVVLATHRPATLSLCNKVLVLNGGMQTAFGPRDQVLRPVAADEPRPLRATA